MIPLLKYSLKDEPCLLLVVPSDESGSLDIDLLEDERYLKNLKVVDGITKEQFLDRIQNPDPALAPSPEDDETETNRKESERMKQSADRFTFTKMYKLNNEITAAGIKNLIDSVEEGSTQYFFESEKVPRVKYSEKVVGEDLKKKVLTSDKDCLLFLQNPDKSQNKGYATKYEKFAKEASKEDVKVYRMRGYNESDQFKFKENGPAVYFFKNGDKANPVELDIKRDLVTGSTVKIATERLNTFVKENTTKR